MAHSKATIERIRKSRLGKHHSKATKLKIREALLVRGKLIKLGMLKPFRHSEATKRLMKRKARGRKPSKKAILAAAEARRTKREVKSLNLAATKRRK